MHFLLLVIVLEVEHNDTVEEVRRHGDDEPDAGSLRQRYAGLGKAVEEKRQQKGAEEDGRVSEAAAKKKRRPMARTEPEEPASAVESGVEVDKRQVQKDQTWLVPAVRIAEEMYIQEIYSIEYKKEIKLK